ncbi:MAG: phytoene/squalene synthase family protein [Pseudomonadota bacterium]
MSGRAALIMAARDSIAKGSKSFAMASRLFDRPTRERVWLLYCWCRACDDLADGQDHGGTMSAVADPHARLAYLKDMTERALRGEPTGEVPFDALALVVSECAIPHQWPRDLIQGFAMDADGFSPRTTQDMLTYCYHVAGVVGLMMAVVMGVDPEDKETLAHANDLGLAFQLANIARDIGEDASAGRCYIPATWLGKADIGPGEHMKLHYRKALGGIGAKLAEMAGGYEESARIGARKLPFRSRWAVLSAAGIYGDIAREVARRGEHAWDSRVFTSKAAKLTWVMRAAVQAR